MLEMAVTSSQDIENDPSKEIASHKTQKQSAISFFGMDHMSCVNLQEFVSSQR